MATPPRTRKIRIQEVQPGMRVERITDDLDFAYIEVEKVVPVKRDGRTQSYKVYLVGHTPGDGPTEHRPFIVRPIGRIAIVDEES